MNLCVSAGHPPFADPTESGRQAPADQQVISKLRDLDVKRLLAPNDATVQLGRKAWLVVSELTGLKIGRSVQDVTTPGRRLLFNIGEMIAEPESQSIGTATREGKSIAPAPGAGERVIDDAAKGRLRGNHPTRKAALAGYRVEFLARRQIHECRAIARAHSILDRAMHGTCGILRAGRSRPRERPSLRR